VAGALGLRGCPGEDTTTLTLAEWPSAVGRADAEAVSEFGRLQELVAELRRFRTQQGIASRRKIAAKLLIGDAAGSEFAAAWAGQLAALADLTLETDKSSPQGWEVLSSGGISVALDLARLDRHRSGEGAHRPRSRGGGQGDQADLGQAG